MKILLLAAMDKEINLLLNTMTATEVIQDNGQNLTLGSINQHEVMLGKCGIGKVNSALNTLRFIQYFKPDMVINSGVAGGAGLPIGTVLVANAVAYHDVWCGPGTLYGQADGLPLLMQPSPEIISIASNRNLSEGLICSGDKFISSAEEIKSIRDKFPEVKAVDMESASIAQCCILQNVPFGIVRVVSDTPGEGENITQYKDFWTKAPEKTFSVLKLLLQELK